MNVKSMTVPIDWLKMAARERLEVEFASSVPEIESISIAYNDVVINFKPEETTPNVAKSN